MGDAEEIRGVDLEIAFYENSTLRRVIHDWSDHPTGDGDSRISPGVHGC